MATPSSDALPQSGSGKSQKTPGEEGSGSASPQQSGDDIIVFYCPSGHKLNAPSRLQGKPGQCPHCGEKFSIPSYEDDQVEEPVEEVAGTATPAESPPALPEMTLQTSDEAVRMALAGAGGSALLDGPLQEDELLQRGAAIIDGTSRGLVLTKILSPSRPEGKFTTVEDQGQELIDPASYDRYDDYAQAIAGVDTAALASAFHRFRPLLEEAYAQLGYAREDFDNALIRSLDVVIATPDIPGTVAVKPKGGLYVFADPALEALPSLQKQLLRMGPENRELVKQQAVALRSALLAEESPQ